MINASVSKNAEEIKVLTHPDYVDSIKNLDQLYEAMAIDGIILDGTLNELTPRSRSYSQNYLLFDSESNEKTTFSVYDAKIGDTSYIIKIQTFENNDGYGIVYFNIRLNK